MIPFNWYCSCSLHSVSWMAATIGPALVWNLKQVHFNHSINWKQSQQGTQHQYNNQSQLQHKHPQHESEEWSSQLIFQFKQLERRSLRKSGLQRDSNPWPPRYRCDAPPTELWSHTLGARSIYWVHISCEEWNAVKYIWNNSYLNCGCRWKWRMIITVNFPI